MVVEPEEQWLIFLLIVITCLLVENHLHAGVIGCCCPFVAKHVIDEQGGRFVRWVVRADECPFLETVILLGKMP